MPYEIGQHRIRRAKSAPSVQKRRQLAAASSSLDCEVARYHATTAASLAMAQAKERLANVSPQRITRPADEVTKAMPSIKAIRGRRSMSSLAEEYNSTSLNPTRAPDNLISAEQSACDKIQALSSADDMSLVREFQGFQFDGDISAPSSYRRLRKSRSMFSTRSLRNLRNAANPSSNFEGTDSPTLRNSGDSTAEQRRSLRHSFSFFNSASESIRRIKSHSTISTRRKHVSKVEEEPPVPPLPVTNEKLLMRKPLRTTVRTLRESSPNDDALPMSNGDRLHSKARSFSITIKKRLKRVFGISGYTESQSSESQSLGPSHKEILASHNTKTIDELARPGLYPTKSSDSLVTSASRVTSWTNSTAGNTVRTRNTLDRQSLSTIEEGGSLINQRQPVFDEIYESDNIRNGRRPVIDSQRIYSALMRHIGDNAERDGDRIVSSDTVKGSPMVVERPLCVQNCPSHGTIHKVPSDLSMQTARASFLTEPRQLSSQSPLSSSSLTDGIATPLSARQAYSTPLGTSAKAITRESNSLFFPTGTSPKVKTPSPYKATMNSIRESENDSDRYTPTIIITGTDNIGLEATSPSIYSRTPSGPAASREDFDYEEEFVEPGMATIFDCQVPYRSPKRRESQTVEAGPKNSAEWRHWMNFQIAHLDNHREHYREESECDGEPLPPTSLESVIASLDTHHQMSTFEQAHSPLDIEIKVQGQSNFSRPLSQQSVGSLRHRSPLGRQTSLKGRRQYVYQESDYNLPHIPNGNELDPFFNDSPEESSSPSRRKAIRAARQARLSRVNSRRKTFGQLDSQLDAKAVQFRSVREVSSIELQNNENEPPPAVKMSGIEDIHSTISSKRMVDMFLDSRRGYPSSGTVSEGFSPVFI